MLQRRDPESGKNQLRERRTAGLWGVLFPWLAIPRDKAATHINPDEPQQKGGGADANRWGV